MHGSGTARETQRRLSPRASARPGRPGAAWVSADLPLRSCRPGPRRAHAIALCCIGLAVILLMARLTQKGTLGLARPLWSTARIQPADEPITLQFVDERRIGDVGLFQCAC